MLDSLVKQYKDQEVAYREAFAKRDAALMDKLRVLAKEALGVAEKTDLLKDGEIRLPVDLYDVKEVVFGANCVTFSIGTGMRGYTVSIDLRNPALEQSDEMVPVIELLRRGEYLRSAVEGNLKMLIERKMKERESEMTGPSRFSMFG